MKATKNLRIVLLVLVMVVCLCLSLASCGKKACEHTGGEATCTEKAVCSSCGESYGELAAHDWADATCTAPKTCKGCGATEGEALGHTGGEATCTEQAVCSTCGESYGEALGHDWVDADCDTPKTCDTCGETEGEANGHDWADATCTAPKTCNDCGATEGEALGHTGGEATCTEQAVCSTCGESYGELLAHTYVGTTCSVCDAKFDYTLVTTLKTGDLVVIGAPAYGKALSTVKVATYYNKGVNYSATNFANITDSEIFVVTVNDDGSYTFTSLTGKTIALGTGTYSSLDETGANNTWNLVAKEGAEGIFYVKNVGRGNYLEWYNSKGNWSTYNTSNLDGQFELSFYVVEDHEHVFADATCDAPKTCSCGLTEGEALGHDWVDATCTAPKTCDTCGATEGEALGHTGGAATCTEQAVCTTCGESYGEALGHTLLIYSYDVENAPTCDIEGSAIFKCTVCGHTEEIGGQYHRYTYLVEYIEGKEPTCTADGHGVFECIWCNTDAIERLVPPAHNYEFDSESYVAPTCTETGLRVEICTGCGDTNEEVLPANGHNWYQQGEIDLENHVMNQECDNCGETRQVSSLGTSEDPIVVTGFGTNTLSATPEWTYFAMAGNPGEGYITFTVNTTNVNIMLKDTTYTYATQFFWGEDENTWVAEIMPDGVYVIAISTNIGEEELEVTTSFEPGDVPGPGETADKAIEMYPNTEYTSTGSIWYSLWCEYGANVTVTVDGTATVYYGFDPENMVEYTGTFVNEGDFCYIRVESDAEVTVIVTAELPVGSMDNPQQIVEGENTVEITEGNYYLNYYAYENVVITITYDVAANPNAVIVYGSHPYMMMNTVENGTAVIEVSAWTPLYLGVNAQNWGALSLTFTVTIEVAASEEPETPENIGEIVDSIEFEITGATSYTWETACTFTATEAGTYTFYLPATVGLWNQESCDSGDYSQSPEVDFYNNETGEYVSKTLAAGEEFVFYASSHTVGTYTIDVYYAA